MKRNLIKSLREGKVAIVNDGNVELLEKVIATAFPHDDNPVMLEHKYYVARVEPSTWAGESDNLSLPVVYPEDFITYDKEDMKVVFINKNNRATTILDFNKAKGYHVDPEWEIVFIGPKDEALEFLGEFWEETDSQRELVGFPFTKN